MVDDQDKVWSDSIAFQFGDNWAFRIFRRYLPKSKNNLALGYGVKHGAFVRAVRSIAIYQRQCNGCRGLAYSKDCVNGIQDSKAQPLRATT